MTCEELKAAKKAFLDHYNPCRTDEKAASDAVKSAAQHNVLYARRVSEREKERVRERWRILLGRLARKYVSRSQDEAYLVDIEALKRMMNKGFADHFRRDPHPRYNYEPGFRISHAQKSLSVLLKHLWCMDRIEIPPECPVDSIVLGAAGLRYPATRWAYVNSIDEHRRKIACLARCAKASGLELAEWELREFQERMPH